ncbi:MAG: sensor domain-containing diguanylate cyclase [Planctomycetes bacterium]|nr:sensor domain-containing diguanylate cyclase [Planctomycetota bacterium]
MSQTTLESTTSQVAGDDARDLSWLPERLWPLVVDHLVCGQDYVVLLDGDLRILHANGSFASEVLAASGGSGTRFSTTVTEGSARELASLLDEGREVFQIELHHPVPAGTRCVLYTFRRRDGMWVAIGRDQTVQLELVSQMATLVNDLEVKVDCEKERSETLKKLSERDALTGLANRRELERIFESYQKLRRESGLVFSVIMIDIDRFKQVNDVHGHPMGDEVLKRVARTLESSLRDGDCVARLGGEEFVVLARGATLNHAVDLAERLRQAIEAAEMPEPLRKVTISLGVSSVGPPAAGSGEERDLIVLADKALYEAKGAGRNCVRFLE